MRDSVLREEEMQAVIGLSIRLSGNKVRNEIDLCNGVKNVRIRHPL